MSVSIFASCSIAPSNWKILFHPSSSRLHLFHVLGHVTPRCRSQNVGGGRLMSTSCQCCCIVLCPTPTSAGSHLGRGRGEGPANRGLALRFLLGASSTSGAGPAIFILGSHDSTAACIHSPADRRGGRRTGKARMDRWACAPASRGACLIWKGILPCSEDRAAQQYNLLSFACCNRAQDRHPDC